MNRPNSTQIINRLKDVLPEIFSENQKIDFSKLRELIGEENLEDSIENKDDLDFRNHKIVTDLNSHGISYNSIEDFLFVLDSDCNMLLCNELASRRLGYCVKELQYRSVRVVYPDQRSYEAVMMLREIVEGELKISNIPLVSRSGIVIPVETRIIVGRWNEKSVFFVVSKDLSRIKFSEEKLSKIFHSNVSACGLSDARTTQFVEVNEAFCELFEVSYQEAVGKTVVDLGIMSAEERERILLLAERDGLISDEEVCVKTKTGKKKYIMISSDCFSLGDSLYRYTIATDITERKVTELRLKESEEKFRLLAENSSDSIWTMDLNGKYTYISPAIFALRGFTPEEVMQQNYRDALAPSSIEKTTQLMIDTISKIRSGIKPDSEIVEVELLRKNGTTVWAEIVADVVFDDNGEFKYFLGVSRNIDERKKAEKKLRESEEQILTLINSTPDFICFKDGEGRWQITNPTGIDLFNLYEIDYVGKNDLEITRLSPESYRNTHIGCIESDKKAWEKGAVYHVEEIIHKPDGTDVVMDVIKVPLYNEDGSKKGLVIIGRDVTEKKRIEEQMIESKILYQTLSNASFESIFITENGICVEQNKTAELTLGYLNEEAIGKNLSFFIQCEDSNAFDHKIISGFEEPFEAKAIRIDGTSFPCLIKGRKMEYKNKNVHIISLTDITKQKNAEKALRLSEEKYRHIFENAPVGILTYGRDSKIIVCNEEFARIIGSPREILLDLDMSKLKDFNVLNAVSKSLQGETIYFEGEYKSVTASKTTQVKARFAPLFGENNEIVGGVAIIEDITESKKAEDKLVASESKYRSLFQTSPTGIIVLDKDGIIQEANYEIAKTTKYTPDELVGESIVKLSPDTNVELIRKHISQILDGEILENEVQNLRKDGTPCYFHLKETAITLPNGKRGILTVSNDITERKYAEQKLIENEVMLRTIIDTEPECIKIISEEGELMMMNSAGLRMLEAESLDQLKMYSVTELIPDEYREAFFDLHRRVIEGSTEQLVFQMIGINGKRIWLDTHATPMVLNGKTVHLAVTRDITEKLKIEKQYEELFNQMQDGFALHEIICDENNKPIDYRFLAVNRVFEAQTGLKSESIVGKTVLEVLPNTESFWIDIYGEVALSGNPTTFENYSGEIGKYFQVTAFSHTKGQFATLITDITSRKEAESIIKNHQLNLEELVKERTKELMVRESYLSAIIDNHPGMFWMKDKDGRFIFSNRSNDKFLKLLYGEVANEIIGKTDFDFCPPYQARSYKKEDGRVVKLRKEIQTEDRITIGEQDFWFQKLKFPVIDSENKTIGVAGYSIDITERIMREKQLQMQSEAFESFSLSIVITDANGVIEWCNVAFEKLTGYTMKEVIGKKTNIFRSGHQSDEFYRHLWKTVHAGLVWTGEFVNKRKDGSTYYEESTITPVRDQDGIISHYIAIKINVTERKEMEEALRLSEQRWQFAIEGSGDGIYDCNLVTNKQYYSPLWKALLGYEDDEIGDEIEEWSGRIHPDDLERCWKDANDYRLGLTKTYSNEHRLRCKDGSYKWVITRGIAINRDENGVATRIIGTLSDITEIKKLEETLRKNIEKERELNEMKTRFVANASHEFRTPLASILITSESLVNYWDRYNPDQIREKLLKIKSTTEFLNNIVDDMLQLSKIEDGKLVMNICVTDIVALCHSTVDEFHEDQLLSRIEFDSDFDELNLEIDEHLIKQAINNLMSNALKYSDPESKIIVRLSRKENMFLLSVRDFGIGIPLSDQKHLFTPYFRASNSRMIKGNGLGLNIIKGIVEMHGGTITFVSQPNKGSTFTLHIPLNEK